MVLEVLTDVADRTDITVRYPALRPDVIGMIVPKARINIRWKGERPTVGRIRAGIAAAMAVAPHHDPKTAAASPAVVFLPQVRRLTDEQLEVMDRLQRLTHGSVYRAGASMEELRASWPVESSSTVDELVDDLVRAGVLYRRGNRVIAHP